MWPTVVRVFVQLHPLLAVNVFFVQLPQWTCEIYISATCDTIHLACQIRLLWLNCQTATMVGDNHQYGACFLGVSRSRILLFVQGRWDLHQTHGLTLRNWVQYTIVKDNLLGVYPLNNFTFEPQKGGGKAARVQGLLSNNPSGEQPLIRLQLLDCRMSCDSRKCLHPEIKKDTEAQWRRGKRLSRVGCCLKGVHLELGLG